MQQLQKVYLRINIPLRSKLSSVDLEKAIRLQQGQMTYKFERLGMCRLASLNVIENLIICFSDETFDKFRSELIHHDQKRINVCFYWS
jgi:hypothetical protein